METSTLSNSIWSVAELLRGDYKENTYGSVILPFTLLRRQDCLLEKTRETVFQKSLQLEEKNLSLNDESDEEKSNIQ